MILKIVNLIQLNTFKFSGDSKLVQVVFGHKQET
jgi:hypothetical protein